MSNEFTEKYFKPCVKEFVSTVLLIDDQLEYGEPEYLPSIENESLVVPKQGVVQPSVKDETISFSSENKKEGIKRKVYVTDLIKSFSKEELLVTPINPKKLDARNKEECIDILLNLASKSDVIILDWDMNISFTDTERFASNELAKNLIEKLNQDNKYRLVMIYTADNENDVIKELKTTSNIEVKIYVKTKISGNAVIEEYNNLAEKINNDFLTDRRGLLGAALIKSLTLLRKSSYSMLSSLKPEYDIALLYHRILLLNPERITDFCSEMLQDEILSHISPADITYYLQKDAFKEYISERKIQLNFKRNEKGNRRLVEKNKLDKLLENGYKSYFSEKTSSDIAKGKHLDFIVKDGDSSKLKEFSYYSSMISSDVKPNLKLGCIVKLDEKYYLCIQPLCDTERLPKKEELTDKTPPVFLFLTLDKNSQMDFFIQENSSFIGLKVNYSGVITMPVFGNQDGVVPLIDKKYKLYDEQELNYISCLKPMFAQKIANNFAANISRVGIDQFEWLRLKGRD